MVEATQTPLPAPSRARKAGLPAGSLVYIGDASDLRPVETYVIEYSADSFSEYGFQSVEELPVRPGDGSVTWVNVEGIHDPGIVRAVGEHFGLHALAQEDVQNTLQRPKLDAYDDYLFIVLKMLQFSAERDAVVSEQLSLMLAPGLLVTFQEQAHGDVFEPVRERIRNGSAALRGAGSDYLAYALIDAVVDRYFGVLEEIGYGLDTLEQAIEDDATPPTLRALHRVKRELISLRQSVWPLREVVGSLQRSETRLIEPSTALHFRDVHDHTVQIMDTIEAFRDVTSGMLDVYISTTSNRLNEVMKVLTVITTIFMPLSFIAGVYGMNFEHMPELEWQLGYPIVLGIMLVVTLAMLLGFRRRGWL